MKETEVHSDDPPTPAALYAASAVQLATLTEAVRNLQATVAPLIPSEAARRASVGRTERILRGASMAQFGAIGLLCFSLSGALGVGLLAVTRPDTFATIALALIDALPGVDVPPPKSGPCAAQEP